jgi:hypothetical protein
VIFLVADVAVNAQMCIVVPICATTWKLALEDAAKGTETKIRIPVQATMRDL